MIFPRTTHILPIMEKKITSLVAGRFPIAFLLYFIDGSYILVNESTKAIVTAMLHQLMMLKRFINFRRNLF